MDCSQPGSSVHGFSRQEYRSRFPCGPPGDLLPTQGSNLCLLCLLPCEAGSLPPAPRWLSKESACQCRRCRFNPWVRKIPWRKKWQLTPVFLPGKFHGQRILTDYSPWGPKELDTTERAHVHHTHTHTVYGVVKAPDSSSCKKPNFTPASEKMAELGQKAEAKPRSFTFWG